jgi:exopolysaccharide production protein ExoQ
MSSGVASVVYAGVIVALFWFDRGRESGVSAALWIPVAWLALSASRTVAQWLGAAPIDVESATQYTDGSPLDAQIFAALLAVGVMIVLARAGRVSTLLSWNLPLVIFVLYCGLSVLWSEYHVVAFKRWTKAVGDVVMVVVVLTERDPVAALKRLLSRCGFLLIPLSILLIKYYPSMGRAYNYWTGMPYNVGVATGKNGLGYICLLFGLGSLWRVVELLRGGGSPGKTGPLIAHGAIVVMTVWLFVAADSATSLACCLAGGGLIAATGCEGLARRPVAVHLLVGAVLFLALYGLFLNPGVGLVEAVGRDATLTGRTELWDRLLPMTVDPLFGTGFESFWLGERLEKMWRIYAFHPQQSHNGYLEVFLNLGWVGVGLIGLVMAWGYRHLVRSLRRAPELGSLRLGFFVVTAMYNLTEHAFRELHPMWIAFLLAVTVVPEVSRREDG